MITTSWDFPRGPAAARMLLAVGAERGLDAGAVLAGTGLTPRALDDPAHVVEAGQELAIARNLLAELGHPPGLGADAGKRYTLGSLGVWGFALMTCPTGHDVLRIGVRYAPLSFAFIRPFVERDDHESRVVFDDQEIPPDVRAFFVERELTKLAWLLPLVLGTRDGITFTAALDPANVEALRRALPDIDLRRGERHVIHIGRPLLDRPLPEADPAAARELEAQCLAMLERRQQRRGIAGRVRSRLLSDLTATPDMVAVARELNMDARTLRRQLEHDGTSFRAISEEVRSSIAVELLRTAGLTSSEVADRLGYHDVAGFARAFRRWTGTTPGAYRPPLGVEVSARD